MIRIILRAFFEQFKLKNATKIQNGKGKFINKNEIKKLPGLLYTQGKTMFSIQWMLNVGKYCLFSIGLFSLSREILK